MKNWKKWLVLLLALATVFALAACNKEEPEETEPTLNKGDANCQHVFTEWVVEKERSCTKKGLKTRKCETCGREEEEVLLAYGHTYYGGECSECGKEAKACEHPDTETVVMSEATCTKDGQEREVCKLCKAVVKYNYISALWHPETKEVVISKASCTENGEIHRVCKLCGEVAEVGYELATGHENREEIIVTAPTCTENGLKQIVCKDCDAVVDEYTLWSNGHTYEYVDRKEPTCTEKGWYAYHHCIICDYQYNYEERPATGHFFQAGTCASCNYVDESFKTSTVPGLLVNPYPAWEIPESLGMVVMSADILVQSDSISSKNEVNTYTLDVAYNGRYCVWFQEIYSGNQFTFFFKNALGEVLYDDYYCVNNDLYYFDLTVGIYTIEVHQNEGYSTYDLYVGCTKPIVDISDCDVVNDNLEFPYQQLYYSFTPVRDGLYYFDLSDMVGNAHVDFRIYNHLNEEVAGTSYVNNEYGVEAFLTAGETYTIIVENEYEFITPLSIYIGKQTPTRDISGYSSISDKMTFRNQQNIYTFVATSSGYRVELGDITNDRNLRLFVYNHLGEELNSTYYCGNGEGFNFTDLVVGNTYAVVVSTYDTMTPYTLYLYADKEIQAANSDMALRDSLEFTGQENRYSFTVDRAGDHKLLFLIHSAAEYAQLSVSIYDENGNLVDYDHYVRNGDYFELSNLTVGSTYTVVVSGYGGEVDYTISFQP